MAKKRRYRIDSGPSGSEITIGNISQSFLKYWTGEKNQNSAPYHLAGRGDLVDFLFFSEEFNNHHDIPRIRKNEQNAKWYEIDDIEHIYGCFLGDFFTIHEVSPDGNNDYYQDPDCIKIIPELKNQRIINYNSNPVDITSSLHPFVLICHTMDKVKDFDHLLHEKHGVSSTAFSSWIMQTDNPLDTKSIAISKIHVSGIRTLKDPAKGLKGGRTDLEVVEEIWYKNKKVENLHLNGWGSNRFGAGVALGQLNK